MKITKQDWKLFLEWNWALILQKYDTTWISIRWDTEPFIFVNWFNIYCCGQTFKEKLKALWFVYKYLFK